MIGAQVQKAIYDVLVAASICSGRIYDRVPDGATYPYVTIGDESVSDQSNSCNPAWDVIADVHVWSRPDGASKAEVKAIGATVVNTVLAMTTVSGFVLSRVDFETSLTRRESDGLTEHMICIFRVCVDPAS